MYLQRLRRALERRYPGFTIAKLSNAMDLERSFGPIYARGLIRQGRSAFAVLGVNQEETQASIDAALTFGILWLDACRQAEAGRTLVEGLKLFLPAETSALTRARGAHLEPSASKWQLYEFDEGHAARAEIDGSDRGNLAIRLVRCADEAAALERFADWVRRVLALLPECEVSVLSPAEIAFRWLGLEFARARISHESGSFRNGQEVVFGLGAEERVLEEANSREFTTLVKRLRETRYPQGSRHEGLWRPASRALAGDAGPA